MSEPLPLTRRDFAATLALLAAAPAAAQPPEGRDTLTATAGSLADVLRLRHGRHLTAEQLRQLRRALEMELYAAERLRRLPLTNADDPAFAFRADLP